MPPDMSAHRIGLLYRGDRRAEHGSERADALLGPLFDALTAMGMHVEHVVYSDEAVNEMRDQLSGLDGVLVWVNPIQDGANRAQLDRLLREMSTRMWVSAHPDVIEKMGTKVVLFQTKALSWGTDTDLYVNPRELGERLPLQLARAGQLVVKQARGNGGNGVWRVELPGKWSTPDEAPPLTTGVRIQHALSRDASFEEVTLEAFLDRCSPYFAWSAAVISQPYQARLRDGMIRCYFVQDTVAGFCHQWPRGLLDASVAQNPSFSPPARGPWEDPTFC